MTTFNIFCYNWSISWKDCRINFFEIPGVLSFIQSPAAFFIVLTIYLLNQFLDRYVTANALYYMKTRTSLSLIYLNFELNTV